MKFEEFKKGIRAFRETRLTTAEEALMLEKIFQAPIESPYLVRDWMNFLRQPMALAVLSLFIVSSSALAKGANSSLPGELLYPIKTEVFEPLLDRFHAAPQEKLAWEEKKIETRIMEAEALAEKNHLDEKKTRELEKRIEKSSADFTSAAEKAASSTATTSLRDKLREKKNSHGEEGKEKEEKKAKVERVKDRAVKTLENKRDKKK